MIASLALALVPAPSFALRLATFHADLSRKGPGLLLRDILASENGVDCAAKAIARARPDVITLTKFDYDFAGQNLTALARSMSAYDHILPHHYSALGNAGWPSDHDLNGDGRILLPDDGFSYGWFPGEGGMAVLSRWPLTLHADLSGLVWQGFPNAQVLSGELSASLPLSTNGHWVVQVAAPTPFDLLVFHATAPVFDGPEDLNGRRNHDEIMLWARYLAGDLSVRPSGRPVAVAGNANLDPDRGEGRRDAIATLLANPALQDPRPIGALGPATADWPSGPGALRVSYVLPPAEATVQAAGVADVPKGCDMTHRLVWVDFTLPRPLPP
ncbi:endonuclease/exonuclease/phosphatase family protein [Pseudoprimorskyibacter insulae]|uniref:Endonuclease/exonuclease/phosphatase domain-containing protein n=1 Tax=Pseudoprimorskyibacter insulae TaxID=1695997 RepID=A0A2R8AYN4_9RHOB|nr:endonuclease/exonuclease/phosphatase family protein [Pseudoprimorskyibacter insulae]SPF81118.1 hypothetical protein PRI8871_02936 [Pseudoprimorskyibacter insulae]